MNLIKYFSGLKKDLIGQAKKNGLKIVGINAAYIVLILFVGLFLLSIIFSKLTFFNDYNDSLYTFKTIYQQNGQISPAQGEMLMGFYSALKTAFLGSSFILFAFAIFYAILRATKTVLLEKLLFKKKLPLKQLFYVMASNFLFLFLLILLVVLILVVFTNPLIVLVLWFLLFLILESLTYSYETKYLFKKKDFLSLFLEHLYFNIVTSLIFILGILVILFLSSLITSLSLTLGMIVLVLLLFLIYIKRELLLYLVINYFEDEQK